MPAASDKAALSVWLRAERESRGWSRSEMAKRLRYEAHARGDYSVPDLESMMHNIYRWERGADGMSERY
jgi:transcriptional regulator with XRE-family HTH domain